MYKKTLCFIIFCTIISPSFFAMEEAQHLDIQDDAHEEPEITFQRQQAKNLLKQHMTILIPLSILGASTLCLAYRENNDEDLISKKVITSVYGIITPFFLAAAYRLHKDAQVIAHRVDNMQNPRLSERHLPGAMRLVRNVACAAGICTAMNTIAPWTPYPTSFGLFSAGGWTAIAVGLREFVEGSKVCWDLSHG